MSAKLPGGIDKTLTIHKRKRAQEIKNEKMRFAK